MSGSSLARCLLAEGREQSTATQFWMRPSSLALSVEGGWGVRKRRREQWVEGLGALCAGRNLKKKGHDGHQVTAFAWRFVDVCVCVMMRGTLEITWGWVEVQQSGANLIWQGQVLHLPGLCSCDKAICTSPINISLFWDRQQRRPTDHHTSVISLPCFFWLIQISSRTARFSWGCWVLHQDYYQTICNITNPPYAVLDWKRMQLCWHAKIGYWSAR